MRYLGLDDLLALACEVLELEVAAALRITDLGLADSALARPDASYEGHEFYQSIEAKAATLLFGVARDHAFVDGNKRIAVLATLQFLNMNGYDLDLSPTEDAFKMITQVAAGSVTVDDLTVWIAERLQEYGDD